MGRIESANICEVSSCFPPILRQLWRLGFCLNLTVGSKNRPTSYTNSSFRETVFVSGECRKGVGDLRIQEPLFGRSVSRMGVLPFRDDGAGPPLLAHAVEVMQRPHSVAQLSGGADRHSQSRPKHTLWREEPPRVVRAPAPGGRPAQWRTHIRCRGWNSSADDPP